jgi:hypothetical protein
VHCVQLVTHAVTVPLYPQQKGAVLQFIVPAPPLL